MSVRAARTATSIVVGLAIVATIVLAVAVIPVRRWATELVVWIHDAGPAAAVGFVAIYALTAVALVPGSVLTLGAGFAYGPVWGTLLVVLGSNLAAAISFAIARRFGRAAIARRAAAHGRFAAIDRAVGRSGLRIALLLRLSPVVPFGPLNYALGVTPITTRAYLLATALGMLPATILYVYLGSLITSAADLGARPTGGLATALTWGGVAALALSVVAITRVARRALDRELATSSPSEA